MAANKITLVIVEDNDLMREGLRSMFERAGMFEVVGEAEDGFSAVKVVESTRPNVVLMDIGLPGQDGIEATRKIRQLVPQTQVVMLTSHNNDEEIFGALSAGAGGYCLKDCASERLKIAVMSVAEGAAWMDPRIASKVLKVFESGIFAKHQHDVPSNSGDSTLSEREKEVLRLMAQGQGNKEIAVKLSIGVSTVRTHVEHILEKLSVSGRTAAAVKAMKEGLI